MSESSGDTREPGRTSIVERYRPKRSLNSSAFREKNLRVEPSAPPPQAKAGPSLLVREVCHGLCCRSLCLRVSEALNDRSSLRQVGEIRLELRAKLSNKSSVLSEHV